MSDGIYTEADHRRADHTMKLLSFTSSHALYDKIYQIALRGWPAWRIAQHLGMSKEMIARLGGPKP